MNGLWLFLLLGYGVTVAIELPVLGAGLDSQHGRLRRLGAGLWLTACTYPIVVIVLPLWLNPELDRTRYLLIAETFAPLAECWLFWWLFAPLRNPQRDLACIAVANLASFTAGECWYAWVG